VEKDHLADGPFYVLQTHPLTDDEGALFCHTGDVTVLPPGSNAPVLEPFPGSKAPVLEPLGISTLERLGFPRWSVGTRGGGTMLEPLGSHAGAWEPGRLNGM
jgi:hypothetical protein